MFLDHLKVINEGLQFVDGFPIALVYRISVYTLSVRVYTLSVACHVDC